jgi:hypothetical protein
MWLIAKDLALLCLVCLGMRLLTWTGHFVAAMAHAQCGRYLAVSKGLKKRIIEKIFYKTHRYYRNLIRNNYKLIA